MNQLVAESVNDNSSNLEVQPYFYISRKRIHLVRHVLLCLPFLGLVMQIYFAQSSTDYLCALLASIGSFVVYYDAFRFDRLYSYPLSTLVVLGFGTTLQLGPLLFTALEGNSLTFNLDVPLLTFGHGTLVCLIVVGAHWVYRSISTFELYRSRISKYFLKINLFQPLKTRESFIMGMFGVAGYILAPIIVSNLGESTGFVRFVEGFQFLAVIPAAFLLQNILKLVRERNSTNHRASKLPTAVTLYVLSVILIVVSGLLKNSRAAFIVPIGSFSLALLFYWLFGSFRIKPSTFIALFLSVSLLLPFFTDLSTAIVVTRGSRLDISPTTLLVDTFSLMSDRAKLKQFRQNAIRIGLNSDLSEVYTDNIFLARFANARFVDNSIVQGNNFSPLDRAKMRIFHLNRLLAILPSPIGNLVGFSQKTKAEVNSVSFGDMSNFLSTKRSYVLGWLRTGHFIGTGLSSFSTFYLIILSFILIFVFLFVDSHAIYSSGTLFQPPILSAIAITQLITWFTFSNAESLVHILFFLMRDFIETVFLFWLARTSVRSLSYL